jgi:hypothetical protein
MEILPYLAREAVGKWPENQRGKRPKMRAFTFCLIFAGLAACIPQPPRPTPAEPADSCGAGPLQGLVGQPATVLHTMKFATEVRIIGPDTAVTMDYSAARLNIAYDRAGKISRIFCG